MEEYEKQFHLLLIDFPGHGESKTLAKDEHTVEKIAEEIYLILNQLSISTFRVVVFSLGTIIAQQMIAEEPHQIKSMIVAGEVVHWNWWSKDLDKAVYYLRVFAPYMFFYKELRF
ncbi:alpha/beta hydrolase [Alkalihalobacillus sp. MEB130]|nr:alpha/beta fold hydrolase [Alkalihalobacillus sp. MEB130]MDT8860244.1 alpha/beta hydrolase [Alkalihalobacillus sp. MEB130]